MSASSLELDLFRQLSLALNAIDTQPGHATGAYRRILAIRDESCPEATQAARHIPRSYRVDTWDGAERRTR